MPRKNKKNKNEEKKEGNILSVLITLLIILIWLVVFVIFVKLDIGGFGSSVLSPIIKDIPILNLILPDDGISRGKNNSNKGNELVPGSYEYNTLEEAIAKIKELEKENKNLKEKSKDSNVKDLQKEIDRLKFFEENQLKFEELKLKFDKNVVFADKAPDIEEYMEYYEMINPDNAEEIYRQVIEQVQYSQAIKEKAEIYSKIEPAAAAKILEVMTADTESIANILLNMKPKASAAILGEMDSVFAARVTKKMIDLDEDILSN